MKQIKIKIVPAIIVIIVAIALIITAFTLINEFKGYDPLDYIVLGSYKGLIPTTDCKVTQEEIDDEIDALIEPYAEKSPCEISENGSVLNIDYTAVINGVTDPDMSGENFEFTIGEGTFISGFDQNLLGKKAGETVKFNLTFPADFHMSDYVGLTAQYTVVINSVERIDYPELTDQTAQMIGDFTGVSDLTDYVTDIIYSKKLTELKDELWEQIRAATTVSGYPEKELAEYSALLLADFTQTAKDYEYTDVYKYADEVLGYTNEGFDEYLDTAAKGMMKHEMILKAIADEQNIEVTDSDYESGVDYYLKQYQVESYTAEMLLEDFDGEDGMRLQILYDKVIEFVIANCAVSQ